MERVRTTVEEVAADPTNAYEVTVHGDAKIASLKIHDPDNHPWVSVQYASGGSSAGCPAHWAAYVRYDEELENIRAFYPDAVELVLSGWTTDAAISHVTGMCDRALCGGNHEES